MSSYRNYSDLGAYRTRAGASVGVPLVRNSASTSLSYRPSYSNVSSIARSSVIAKERGSTSGYGNGALKRERSSDDKPLYKYGSKTGDKTRLNPGRASSEDVRAKSPISGGSLLEKYSYPAGKTPSVLEKYGNRIFAQDKSREHEAQSKYVTSTGLRANYTDTRTAEKKEHPAVSYRPQRTSATTSTRSSREPSPEVSTTKANSFRGYARVPNYGPSTGSTEGCAASKFINPSRAASVVNRSAPSNGSATGDASMSPLPAAASKISSRKPDEEPSKTSAPELRQIKSEEKDLQGKLPEEKVGPLEDKEEVSHKITLTVVSRGTSPGPPASSSFVRSRRAEAARTIQREITRVRRKIETKDVEVQSDRGDDVTTRYSRFSTGTRVWPSYLDKFPTSTAPYSRVYNSSSSRISNFGYSRQSESPTSTRSASTPRACQNTNPEIPSQAEDSKVQHLSPTNPPNSESELSKDDSCKDSLSSRARDSPAPKSRGSSKQRQMTRDSSDGSVPTGKSKSTSTSQAAKIRTSQQSLSKDGASSSSSRQSASDARGKPPVPKSDVDIRMKTTSLPKYVNKDFRKSALNMPDADSKSKLPRKRAKSQRSGSVSSQDSESNITDRNSAVLSSLSNSCPRLISAKAKSESPASGRIVVLQNAQSGSKSPRKASVSTSSEGSSDSSSSGSSEDGQRSDCRRRLSKTSSSPRSERKHRVSVSSSRTSVLVSSADELSLTMDKPPRSPSVSRRSGEKSKTEEAKSILMRALGPVANLFKSKDDDPRADSWPDKEERPESKRSMRSPSSKSITQNVSKSLSFAKADSAVDKPQSASSGRHLSSGEKPWWMDANSDNVPEGVERGACPDEVSQETTVSTNLPDDGKFKSRLWRQDSGEQSWWLNQDDTSKREFSSSPSSRNHSSRTNSTDRRNRLKHQQSGERAWWMSEDPSEVPEGVEVYPAVAPVSPISLGHDNVDNSGSLVERETLSRSVNRIRHVESGEKAWWMDSNSNIPEGVEKISPAAPDSNSDDSSESFEKLDIQRVIAAKPQTSISRFPIEFPVPPSDQPPLGDRASPEGIENPPDPPEHYSRLSAYENGRRQRKTPRKRPSTLPLFIGSHTNIDDLLGEADPPQYPSVMSRVYKQEAMAETSDEGSECEEIDAAEVIIHDSTPKTRVIQRPARDTDRPQPDGYIPLDDTALQLYKDGDYGAYLDLEASISEQQEEFDGFQTNRKNSIVLRTQLSVRVHTIIEKLLNSEGRELRRALFSLKQIFQEDKDLVHEFVQNDGLACLIKVGNEADQNYQNYILRALGQVMLYVDGMNGVMEHGQTVQWLYTLIASRFRLVVKTALKLLLVFVEYVETNSLLLVRAVRSVDTSRGMIPWTNVMKLLKDYDAADTELLIYATTLVNKCLNGIPDQDTYYDQVDCLEEQGIEGIIQRYMSKQGTDLDLLRQFQIYEAVLHHEDGNDRGSPIRQLDDNIRKTLRSRKSLVDSHERRKSRRHSTGTSPLSLSLNARLSPRLNHSLGLNSLNGTFNSSLPDDDDESSSSQGSQGLGDVQLNGSYKENKSGYPTDVGVTPALRRRRERAERQRSFIREQQEATATMRASVPSLEEQEAPYPPNGVRYTNGSSYDRNNDASNKIPRANSRKDLTPLMNAANKLDSEEKKPWYGKSPDEGVECDEGNHTDDDEDRRVLVQIKREGTVKDLTQKLAAQNLRAASPAEEKVSRIGDMSGLISKAKEGLAKSKSKADILKSPTGDNLPKLAEVKKSENELHWEELVNQMKRPLALCDLDFTDLNSEDEIDVLGPVNVSNGVPPPPPPMAPSPNGSARPPPPPPGCKLPPPFPTGPPLFGVNLKSNRSPVTESSSVKSPPPVAKKSKKTVKLFWKEVRDDPIILSRLDKNTMIWDEILPVPVDTQKLEHLFESRAKDLITKKQQEMNKNKEIIVLDHKRSNAINIGMTKLPPPRSIKTAILKMDATIMNREGIEKLLTMLPTEEERSRIQEAQAASPDLPLGSAEQFLLTLASISELPARLKLWAFKLDFENSEKEIADPLMDLKQGMETLRVNKTFRGILSTLLSIGIFLNGNEVKGFQLEYLTKVPEVKDTVHKHSLLHHLCHMVMEKFPDSTDLYSEIGAVTRASKIDFDELASNIGKLESECKASWDHLKLIAKHDGSTMMKVKMSDFLADCAERIIVLGIVHRRIINRFHKFILWLGIPLHRLQDTKPNEFCRIISEFALEYRTTRERVLQQLEKKANHRERNKTRGKMITEVGKFRTKEDRADAELRQLLGSDISDVESIHGTLPWRRQRKDGRTPLGPIIRDEPANGNVTDGDDELLESLVKTATTTPATRTTPRERKRTRHADRKSLRRTLKNGLSEEEKKHIAAYIKGY